MKITLVTPTLDAERYLAEALVSLEDQGSIEVEHIVVDGGSTDGTLALVQRSSDARIVHAPGSSLYAALNAGVALATGDIIGFLNADDVLAPGALAAIAREFDKQPAAQMVSGGGEVFRDSGTTRQTIVHINDGGAKSLREQDVIHGARIINSRYFRRELLERVGQFDTRWPRCADADLLMRLVDLDPKRSAVPQVVYRSRAHADSLTFRGGIELDLTAEELDLCKARLDETDPATSLHARYRRWHSWEVAYLAGWKLRQRSFRQAVAEAARGLRVDPRLPVVVPVQVAQHLVMRAQHR